nr:HD domain-containing protein [Pseudomonas luteola]
MTLSELMGTLRFLKDAEMLKDTLRTAYTRSGKQESTAEHTWRLCLMAMVYEDELQGIDFAKLLKICLIHDLGEAISGDIPAVLQRPGLSKSGQERQDLQTLLASLPAERQERFLALWDEYENGSSPEAKFAKGLDKLETILQHNQGLNPPDFDYGFNLNYGRQYTSAHPLLAAIREQLDEETERRTVAH